MMKLFTSIIYFFLLLIYCYYCVHYHSLLYFKLKILISVYFLIKFLILYFTPLSNKKVLLIKTIILNFLIELVNNKYNL